MATIRYNNVGIKAMSACVPARRFDNRKLGDDYPKEEVEHIIGNIGVLERRLAPADITASDLAVKAAIRLMEDNAIEPDSIDVLLFMSQTQDYRIPATSCLLQHRLGLSKECCCIDLSLGCSGYVFALSTAYAYASQEGVRKVMLIDAETFSKIVNPKDKVDWPLYGDAATATLVEKGDYGESVFQLRSDGAGEEFIKIKGGMRYPITEDSLKEMVDSEGNVRNELQIYMDGLEVFNFSMRVVPKSVREICQASGTALEDIDWLVFHQANKFMTDFFPRKLKFPAHKAPNSIQSFGNTSSASIPLTIVSQLEGRSGGGDRTVLCGFGAGMSWGTAYLTLKGCNISPVFDY